MARKKIKEELALKNWLAVDAALREIAMNEVELAYIEAELNKQITGEKKKAEQEAQPYKDRVDSLSKDIKAFAVANKKEIDGKTRNMFFGKVGFRKSTKLTVPTAKEKVADIIAKLRSLNMNDCINVKEDVNKEVLKKYEEDTIASVGAKLKVSDEFWYETDHQKLEV